MPALSSMLMCSTSSTISPELIMVWSAYVIVLLDEDHGSVVIALDLAVALYSEPTTNSSFPIRVMMLAGSILPQLFQRMNSLPVARSTSLTVTRLVVLDGVDEHFSVRNTFLSRRKTSNDFDVARSLAVIEVRVKCVCHDEIFH